MAIQTLQVRAARRIGGFKGWMFILPVVLGTAVFNILPMAPTLWISLTSWDIMTPPKFKGIGTYVKLFQEPYIVESIKVTLIYAIGTIPLCMIAGLFLAILVNQELRGIGWFRGIYFLPVVTSSVAIGMAWRWMFNTRYGAINYFLGALGLGQPRWLGHPAWAMSAIIIVSVWQRMGYNMVIFLAGLQDIPRELIEAASIDGAKTWQKFRHVTLPLLTPVTFFILIMSIIFSFQSFALVYVITGGGPGFATSVYVYKLWKEAFQFYRWGFASAMSWILFVAIALITVFQWWLSKRWVFYQ
jgi:multiple sugar transport system permease protein